MFLRSPLEIGKARSKRSKPVKTLFEERPLSAEEKELLLFLLSHTNSDAAAFLPQVEETIVTGRCSCGCPTIDLKGPDQVEEIIHRSGPLVDASGKTSDNRHVGVLVWANRRQLTGLEVYNLSESDEPWGLPTIESLTAFSGEALQAVSKDA